MSGGIKASVVRTGNPARRWARIPVQFALTGVPTNPPTLHRTFPNRTTDPLSNPSMEGLGEATLSRVSTSTADLSAVILDGPRPG
jgi:hypothetical protein